MEKNMQLQSEFDLDLGKKQTRVNNGNLTVRSKFKYVLVGGKLRV